MKKIVYLFSLLLMIIPIGVFADMGAPSVNYKAIVVTDNAPYYRSDEKRTKAGTLKAGTEIEVIMELEDYVIFDYKDDSFEISLKDIKAKKNFNMDDYIDKNKTHKGKVLDKNGVDLYEGPGEAFEKVGDKVPFEAEVTIYSVNDKFNDEVGSGDSWIYIKYNDVSGWVDSIGGSVGQCLDNDIYLPAKTNVLKFEEKEGYELGEQPTKVIGSIPANTTISYKNIFMLDEWSKGLYYVEYNDIKGYVIYSSYDDKIESSDILFIPNEGYKLEILNDKVKLYDSRPKTEEEGKYKTVSKADFEGVKVKYLDGSYLYVENDKVKGWIEYTLDLDYAKEDKIDTYFVDGERKEEPEPTPVEEPKVEPKKEEDKDLNTTIICVAAGVVICITALTTIVLVNKKRKAKKNKVEQGEVEVPVTENDENNDIKES